MFRSVKPSRATLVRVALNGLIPYDKKKNTTLLGGVLFW